MSEHVIIIDNHEDELTTSTNAGENKEHKIILPVSNAASKAEDILEYVYDRDDDDSRQNLYALIDEFLAQEFQPGSAHDFHNFAVGLARRDEYLLACRVLECGLECYPKNVDLLADYLQYGVSCNKFDECKRIYKTLIKIPRRRWTWRGFAFLVDYLQFLIDRSDSDKDIDAREKEMLDIVRDFKELFPYSEEPYRTEANVCQTLNMPDKEADVLKTALENVKVAPKCALRFADLLFDRGLYEEATSAIQRAISDATQTQTSVNEGYLYYLSALCKIAIMQRSKSLQKSAIEEAVKDVYSDFNIALTKFQNTNSMYIDVIRTKTNTLVNKTGVEVDASFELLCEYAAR